MAGSVNDDSATRIIRIEGESLEQQILVRNIIY